MRNRVFTYVVVICALLVLALALSFLLMHRESRPINIGPLPDREIVFTDDAAGLGFINADGSGYTTISLPWAAFYGTNWSFDGNYLAMRRPTSYDPGEGYPMLVSAEGDVLECPGFQGAGRVWGVSETNVVAGIFTVPYETEEVTLLDMVTCERLDTLYSGTDVGDVAISSQGWLAIVDGDGIRIQDPEGEEAFYEPGGYEPAWSPDGEWLAYASYRYTDDPLTPAMEGPGINIIRREGTDRTEIVSPGGGPSWSPDGEWIVYCHYATISKVNVDTGENILLYSGHIAAFPSWRWSDGQ
jgi:hypothetical protein